MRLGVSADAEPHPPQAGDARARESLTIHPAGARWPELLASRPIHGAARRFREQLGLPADRPIVMTGHQAAVWHAGILAKYLACDAAGRALGASPAWVVVDQESPPADTLVRYPAREAGGRLVARELDLGVLGPGAGPRAGTGFDFVDAGLARITAAWGARAGEPSPARRMAGVLADLMASLMPGSPMIFASGLAGTDLFGALIEAMRRNPGRCIGAFNEAARAHPSAGIRPLVADDVQDRYELPLWRLPKSGPRRRVYAEDLASIPREELAPRALMLTAVLRLGGCELFIHGTGGGGTGDDDAREGYDRVTDDWLAAWARADPTVAELLAPGLAPVATVTATRLLPLAHGAPPTEAEVARLAWRWHRARHDPAELGDAPAANAKRALVAAIGREPRHSGARRERYARMHALLDGYRAAHAGDLAALREAVARGRAARAEAGIINDRTWAFPLQPEGALLGLRDEIDGAFGVGATARCSPAQR